MKQFPSNQPQHTIPFNIQFQEIKNRIDYDNFFYMLNTIVQRRLSLETREKKVWAYFDGISERVHQQLRCALSQLIKKKENQSKVFSRDFEFFCHYFRYLYQQPMGHWDLNLLNFSQSEFEGTHDPYLIPDEITYPYFALKLACERYVQTSSRDKEKRKEFLYALEEEIIVFKRVERSGFNNHYFNFSEKCGTGSPYSGLLQSKLCQNVYNTHDEALSQMFYTHLPHPKPEHFRGQKWPKFLENKAKERDQQLRTAYGNLPLRKFLRLEQLVVALQRRFRAQQRQKEECHRIREYNRWVVPAQPPKIDPKTPIYIPKRCSSQLAARIVRLAQQISFIDIIYHKTHQQALKSILDEGVFGRKTLLSTFRSFSQAALSGIDIANGDINVVCFTAGHGSVDPLAQGKVSITLDFKTIQKQLGEKPHNMFFKQLDFGYGLKKARKITLSNDLTLVFDHTSTDSSPGEICMRVGSDKESTIDYCQLISYDIQHMEQVLILNFFRFLDQLKFPKKDQLAKEFIQRVYTTLDAMDDAKLSHVLKQIGLNASDTMEFNFFGAHQIDFDTVISISKHDGDPEKQPYVLKLNLLIEQLQKGQLTLLKDSQKVFPELYRSFRFVDFLSFHTQNQPVLNELNGLRKQCGVPKWYPKNECLDPIRDRRRRIKRNKMSI